MSKTSDKSLIADRLRAYWKRFGVLGTGFARRYRYDIFFRTETNIVLLQTGFVLLILALVISAISFAYSEGHNLFGVGALIIAATAVFGYLVARITLAPTRTALIAQKQFVGNIAHELRTPLSIIKTNTEIALLEPALEPGFKKTLRSNIEELDRISHTINNLLSMSSFLRPEKIEFSDIDLGKALADVLQALAPLAEHKHVAITISKSEYRTVLGNAAALSQIIANVLKNAIAYTAPGGRVAVAIEPDYRGSINLTVEDSGIGIRQKDLESIFEPFYRVDYSRNRAFGGSGLGLAIVSELVKLHHGKISIRSTLGKGTLVLISLPCGELLQEGREASRAPGLGEIAVDFSRA